MKRKRFLKPPFNWIVRVIGSAIFLWLILRAIDLEVVISNVRDMNLYVYLLLFVLFLFYQYLTALRWFHLLQMVGIRGSMYRLYRSVLYGQLISRILPTSVGGDTARAGFLLARYPHKKYESVSATLMDRVVGIYSLVIIAVITLPFVTLFTTRERLIGFLSLILFLVFSGLTLWGRLDSFYLWVMKLQFIPDFIGKRLQKFWDTFLAFRKDKTRLFAIVLFSLFTQIVLIGSQYLTFVAVGGDLPVLKLFLVTPIVNIITLLPISIGGLGLREAALVRFLDITNDTVLSYTLIRYSYYIFLPAILFVMSLFVDGWGDFEGEKDDGSSMEAENQVNG